MKLLSVRITTILVLSLLAVACGGAGVESLGNSADRQLASLAEGESISFAEVLDLETCDEVTIIGPYTPEDRQRELVGDIKLNLATTEALSLLVARVDGETVRAVRMARVPVDIAALTEQTFDCNQAITNQNGRAVVG